LERNNEVLETISELADVRDQGRWLDLGSLRSMLTRTAVNVYRLIENLNFITEGRYKSLDEIFAGLEQKIVSTLEVRTLYDLEELYLPLGKVEKFQAPDLGAKAARLGAMTGLPGVRVPPGVAFTAYAYHRFLEHNDLVDLINKACLLSVADDITGMAENSRHLEDVIMEAELPPDLEEALQEAYQSLQPAQGEPLPVVMRSSAVGEDQAGASFAGLYRSVINPSPEALGQAYRAVVASKFSPRAMTYLVQKGFYHELHPMGVLLMAMIPARAGGVMFTREPSGPQDAISISAVWGLGKMAVEGSITPDLYRLSRDPDHHILDSMVADKPVCYELKSGGGIFRSEVRPEQRQAPCLDQEQMQRLAKLGLELEKYFGGPQDVEWCLDQAGELYLVQSRPLQTEDTAKPWRELYPWDELENDPEPLAMGMQVASAGAGSGPAVVLQRANQAAGLAAGSVPLVRNTSPDLVDALVNSSAMLAERGNPSGHLAIIAREFGVPLLIGFPLGRAEKLTSLPEVTVDAYTGSVFPGRVEPLLRFAAEMGIQEETAPPKPAQQMMEKVLGYVTPLNLTNPRDPSFRPQAIGSIHDIIRFAHEKSINAMFEINDSRLMRRGRVVRLKSEVPLDIYLIDLGKGINPEAKAKRSVIPEDITSIPMQALYQGMITPGVRWAGHIPIDFRGFMSVFANTVFDGSKYERRLGDRSYAIISGHYANFSSRLGYHFSIVDAFVGGQENENYISFRFKGGAAALEKRTRRAQFLREVLERLGFWVDQKADLINARVKRLPRREMLDQLKMLGRLMGCSRQLDVTMVNDRMVGHYVDLFLNGDYSMGYGDESREEAS
jgi:pyruvate,water dikinase